MASRPNLSLEQPDFHIHARLKKTHQRIGSGSQFAPALPLSCRAGSVYCSVFKKLPAGGKRPLGHMEGGEHVRFVNIFQRFILLLNNGILALQPHLMPSLSPCLLCPLPGECASMLGIVWLRSSGPSRIDRAVCGLQKSSSSCLRRR
jgi:hypothetical protein